MGGRDPNTEKIPSGQRPGQRSHYKTAIGIKKALYTKAQLKTQLCWQKGAGTALSLPL